MTNPLTIVKKPRASQVPSVPGKQPKSLMEVDQQAKSRIKVDPATTTVILFPGQGAQFVGMGKRLLKSPNVEKLFTTAQSILGYDLLNLCLNGPIETLYKTEFCQPAIFVTSLAAVEHLRAINPAEVESCVTAAGFSIGEFTALVFAGALSFEDGLRLVKLRGEAMQHASEQTQSGLITVFLRADAQIKLACQAAQEWCIRVGVPQEHAVCSIANYLFPHCKVIGGHEEALKFLDINSDDFGIKKIRRLPVSAAFHTKLMRPAVEVLHESLERVTLELPLIPVYSNVDGQVYRSVDDIRKKLVQQVYSPVRWEQIVHKIYDRTGHADYPRTFECGPGNALLSTLAMVNRGARKHAKFVQV